MSDNNNKRRSTSIQSNIPKQVQKETNEKLLKNKEKSLQVTEKLVNDISQYMCLEMKASVQDYNLLAALNNAAAKKYEDVNKNTDEMVEYLKEINNKMEEMKPILSQVDELDSKVCQVEDIVKQLDDYSIRLENEFRKFYASNNK